MQTSIKTGLLATIAIVASSFSMTALEKPEILAIQPLYGGGLKGMSQNGLWAVGDAPHPANGSYNAFPRLVDTTTGMTTELFSEEEGVSQVPMSANCVSNDGKTVGGDYNAWPAVWKEGKGWQRLASPGVKYTMGVVSAITPDGRYAAGRMSIDLFNEYPCLWDLETLKLVNTPGMVASNPRYQDMIQWGLGDPSDWLDSDVNVRLTGITPDGRTVLGMVDFAYPQAAWEFIYSLDTETWTPLGMKYENGRLTSLDSDLYNVDECFLSADGSWIGGVYHTNADDVFPFSCRTAEPENFTLHTDGDGLGVWAIGSDGVPYGASPYSSPIRDWNVKVGKYWYDWKSVIKQLYDIDWMEDVTKDDMGNSGTVGAISDDGKTILSVDWAERTSYIIRLPKPMAELCTDVDLLGEWYATPASGAEFSMLQSLTIQMGREVDVLCGLTDAYILDEEGNRVRNSIKVASQPDNKSKVVVTFRNYIMEPGKTYTVVLPEGALSVAGDAERVNKEIRVTYKGRADKPVELVKASPADGASVAKINLSTNPVIFTFDAVLGIGESPYVGLYQINDDKEEFLYTLNATIDGRDVMVYPVSEQRLADGNDYRIEFGAGTVTDLSGEGANETFSITYHGSYVPEIDTNSSIIFKEDFSTGVANMLLYDGDGKTPTAEMQGYDFTATGRPWVPERDENDDNYAAGSHSCYEPAGQSDDWMVTPQMFIPDDKAALTFKSQGFRKNKQDMLKVYVWASDEVVTIMTAATADKIRYNGDLVYNKLQSPGASEENLAGDWTNNRVDLSKYAGKYIYIAFVNDNRNQSMVFVDDVLVSREVLAAFSVSTPSTMIDASETKISGRVQIMKELEGVEGYELTLYDASHNVLKSKTEARTLAKDDIINFEFEDAQALQKGAETIFYVSFAAADEMVEVKVPVRNLMFETTRRIVLEEYTGSMCPNCPMGIIAVEKLLEMYGDRFIPVSIHSYPGDIYGSTEMSAYSNFLNLNAAPTGVINRGEITNPMYGTGNDFIFTAPDGLTWLQHADAAMTEYADADINITGAEFNTQEGRINVAVDVEYALDREDISLNLFGVIMEDNLFGVQSNGRATVEAPGLGEWGKGGKYGQSSVPYYYDDVARGSSANLIGSSYVGFNGRGGLLPVDVRAGEKMSVDFEFALPKAVTGKNDVKVCVMLINATTGEVINAALSPAASSGVEGISAENATGDIIDISGRIVKRNATHQDLDGLDSGIYVFGGRKYVVK